MAAASALSAFVSAKLQEELEATQKTLKDVEENIRKLTGRDPSEFSRVPNRRQDGLPAISSDFRNRDQFRGRDGGPPGKRRLLASAFSRLGPPRAEEEQVIKDDDSGDDDDLPHKPTIQSSVVATPKEVRTRKDTLEKQKNDKRGMERNRRMFGMMLGTLQKFQSEENKRKEQAQKRAEIEKKLEAAAEKERESVKKERQELFLARREKQAQIRRLEQKVDIAKLHEEWESKHKFLLNFILTKTEPHIMYLPARHNTVSQMRLKQSQKKIEEVIFQQRSKIEEELKQIDEWYTKATVEEEEEEEELEASEAVVNKENRGPANDADNDLTSDKSSTKQQQSGSDQNTDPVLGPESNITLEALEDSSELKLLETNGDPPKLSGSEQLEVPVVAIVEEQRPTKENEEGAEKTLGVLVGDEEFEPIYDE